MATIHHSTSREKSLTNIDLFPSNLLFWGGGWGRMCGYSYLVGVNIFWFGDNFSNLVFSFNFITFSMSFHVQWKTIWRFQSSIEENKNPKFLYYPEIIIFTFYLPSSFLSMILIYLYNTWTMLYIVSYRLNFYRDIISWPFPSHHQISFKNLIINI